MYLAVRNTNSNSTKDVEEKYGDKVVTVKVAPYVVISNLVFESLASFQQSFGTHAETILADLPNFTNVQPQVQINEVV